MSAVCPAGHTSTSEDYCDVCGMPIEAGAVGSVAAAPAPSATSAGAGAQTGAPIGQACPNCDTQNWADALFCENCGYDFTTGTMPRPLDPPDQAPESPVGDAPELPVVSPLAPPDAVGSSAPTPGPTATPAPAPAPAPAGFSWVAEVWIDPAWYQAQESPDPIPSAGLPEVVALLATSCLIGRVSKSRNIHPEIDCGTDSGVSRRQAQLTTDGNRWWVEDLESANGTFVGSSSGAVPEDPIPVGAKAELTGDQRIYVGAWTRIVVRRATEDEQTSLG